MRREERIEKIQELSQRLHELCDGVMFNLEEEMTEAELVESTVYLACGKLTGAIEESITIFENDK